MIENPEINWRGHFNWALLPEDLVTPYFLGEGIRVNEFSENYHFSVPLPGHTHAHTGYLIEDTLIAGDSVYPVEYWKKLGILYYTDPDCAIESLKKILELEWDYLVPGHGDVLSRDEGMKLVRENIRSIESVDSTILSVIDEEVTESEILARASKIFGSENVKAALNILKPSVSGHISSLYRRGLIEVELNDRGITFCRS